MNSFDPSAYGPAFAPLLQIDRRRPLDAGTPNRSAVGELNRLFIDETFAHVGPGSPPHIADRVMASCCFAGVCLLHDYLDKSHSYSQRFDTPSANYWHAIMHRREGDFSNAKYWFRRVGEHPVLDDIPDYDPFDFVDRCEAVIRGKSNSLDECLDAQQAEWELLFDYCYRAAVKA